MNEVKFSILVCSLENRKHFLFELIEVLKPQLNVNVELLVIVDNGENSIGCKRNLLLEKSAGKYIAFVDDDDLVSNDYVELILNAIDKNPDVIGIHLHHYTDGILTGLTYHSLKYDSWWQEKSKIPNLINYYRNPNHLNPVKKEYALKAMFPEINFGEDKIYSQSLLPYLKTEVMIEQEIYHYYFRSNKNL